MSQEYYCAVSPDTDALTVSDMYASSIKKEVMVFSVVQSEGRSTCIMLDRDQLIKLGNQIQDFIIHN